jgi:hypothetical protein
LRATPHTKALSSTCRFLVRHSVSSRTRVGCFLADTR